jgi:CHAT domain-containing protein
MPVDLVPRLVDAKTEAARRRVIESNRERLATDEALTLLKSEAERFTYRDPHVALRLGKILVEVASAVGRPDHAALGMLAQGDALYAIGGYPEGLALYERGGEALRALGDEVGWARSRIGWVRTMHRVGRARDAIADVERAQAILAASGNWYRAGNLDLNTAWIHYELGDFETALGLLDRAMDAYARAGDPGRVMIAQTKLNRAILLTALGDFRTALALHAEARAVFEAGGELVSLLRSDYHVATVYTGQGQYTRALRLNADVFAGMEGAGLEVEAAWVALNMLECYLGLNRDDEALALAEETVARFERCGTPTEAAKARFYSAVVHARLGDRRRALERLDEAADAFAESGQAGQLGAVALHRAGLHLADRAWDPALAEAEQARGVFSARGMAVRQAQADLAAARALVGLSDQKRAAERARSALAVASATGAAWLGHEGHHVLAGVARAQGQVDAALAEYDRALAAVERVQSRLATELRTNFLADKLEVFHDAIDCALSAAQPARAFQYLERAKSAALVDYLASNLDVRVASRPGADPELERALAGLREEHAWLYSRLNGHGLAERPEQALRPDDAERLAAQLRDREREIARLLERIALDSHHGRDDVEAAARELPSPWQTLDDGVALVEYHFGRRGGVAFVATRGDLAAVPLEVGPEAIARTLRLWQLNLSATARAIAAGAPTVGLADSARGLLQALHRALLGPVAARLDGLARLIVVPFGLTHGVPFHALHDGRRHLLETVEVSAVPSSAVHRLCAQRAVPANPTALALACSDGGRLTHVVGEAQGVVSTLGGRSLIEDEATRAALAAGVERHGVLHLAAHGEARLDNPTFAHVKLADGPLTTADVFKLPLEGALVVLSACESGRAAVHGGDELVGLTRGFLYAGAAALVQSLWRVEDGSTARLMDRFYRALQAGWSASAALREAQLASRDEDGQPFLWAPFQLVGDGERALRERAAL